MSGDLPYELTTDREGKPQIVRKADGTIIPHDVENQDFCDVVTWVSAHETPPEGWEKYCPEYNAVVFADKSQLVDRLKDDGCLLYFEPRQPSEEDVSFVNRQTIFYRRLPGEGDVYQLLKAVANDDAPLSTPRDGVSKARTNLWVSRALLVQLCAEVQAETSDIRRLSNWTVDRAFVYLDVSDFSKYEPGQQALIINSLTAMPLEMRLEWSELGDPTGDIQAQLCIGDGYIYCFTSAVSAACFASRLANKIEHKLANDLLPVEFHFRIGIHYGPVYHFWDNGRRDWNYVGAGINGGNRVLAAMGKSTDDMIYLSSQVREELTRFKNDQDRFYLAEKLLNVLDNRGRHADKHGNMWCIYALNHARINS